MSYQKTFIYGYAYEKEAQFGNILNVGLQFDELVARVKAGELKVGSNGFISFSIMKKKPESIKKETNTHNIVHSYYVADGETKSKYDGDSDDSLPF